MALIACNKCGKKISNLSSSCPHCSIESQESPTPISKAVFVLFNVGLLAWAIWAGLFNIGWFIVAIMALIIWAIGFLVYRYFQSIEKRMKNK